MDSSSFHILPVETEGFYKFKDYSSDQGPRQFYLVHLIALIFICLAVVFVPENPNQVASICQKHNSTNACQVW